MKKPNLLHIALPLALAASLLTAGCSKKSPQQANEAPQQYPAQGTAAPPASQTGPSSNSAPAQSAAAAPEQTPPAAAPAPPPQPVSYTIPRGTHIRVTTNQELGSKLSQSGETFTASVADPIVVDGRTLVRAGSRASGTVIVAKALGHFKGQAELALRLDTIRSGGDTYNVRTSTIERVEKGKGKRTAVLAGGGGGLGAIIGGLAGGGKGALIGALAGGGAGTAGAAFTGNKEIVIPAEDRLTFRLERSVTVTR
jgi:hypothetical protein